MIDLTGVSHHPALDEIVDVLCRKTENTDRGFFQAEVAYFLAKMASCQRAVIVTKDRGEIPVNMYSLALATSGFGKGHSVHIMENEVMMAFKKRFMNETMPLISENNLWTIANQRAIRNNSDPQEEFDKVEAEFHRAGAYPFTFDSGTSPAVKQLRHKLLMANCGSINLQIDEIGSNMLGNMEVLTLYLELYDQGIVKQKLTKNTTDSIRGEELDGKTPTNMLLFGTPIKLLDGGQTEDQFFSLLETGYARRCLFGLGLHTDKAFRTLTPEQIYMNQIQPANSLTIQKWADVFVDLADPIVYGWKIDLPDPVGIELVAYRCECERLAELMADHEEIRKAEMAHRYFKALKLAGTYAFIDKSSEITIDHLKQAILLVEESGSSFQKLLTREKPYMKLAKYIATVGTSVTHADLQESLPFYKSSVSARNELITMATAWGYRQHIIIKKNFIDGIEFFRGETLKETKLDEVMVSYSDHFAYNYTSEKCAFDQLPMLTQCKGMHWVNHWCNNGHREENSMIPGFNLIVIDVDEGISLAACQELMKEYEFITYTTKRHTDESNRFRLILVSNYTLEMDTDEYREFMDNIMSWLPFKTDESANQRSKKWESHDGEFFHNKGTMLDVLPFIPRTKKNEEYKAQYTTMQSLDNLERWFAQRIATGNRNNQMIKFALALVDSGQSLIEVQQHVHAFNEKLNNPMAKSEIDSTIMVTIAKRYKTS